MNPLELVDDLAKSRQTARRSLLAVEERLGEKGEQLDDRDPRVAVVVLGPVRSEDRDAGSQVAHEAVPVGIGQICHVVLLEARSRLLDDA